MKYPWNCIDYDVNRNFKYKNLKKHSNCEQVKSLDTRIVSYCMVVGRQKVTNIFLKQSLIATDTNIWHLRYLTQSLPICLQLIWQITFLLLAFIKLPAPICSLLSNPTECFFFFLIAESVHSDFPKPQNLLLLLLASSLIAVQVLQYFFAVFVFKKKHSICTNILMSKLIYEAFANLPVKYF